MGLTRHRPGWLLLPVLWGLSGCHILFPYALAPSSSSDGTTGERPAGDGAGNRPREGGRLEGRAPCEPSPRSGPVLETALEKAKTTFNGTCSDSNLKSITVYDVRSCPGLDLTRAAALINQAQLSYVDQGSQITPEKLATQPPFTGYCTGVNALLDAVAGELADRNLLVWYGSAQVQDRFYVRVLLYFQGKLMLVVLDLEYQYS